jgi:TM2 domain-containing membrane protein YozV
MNENQRREWYNQQERQRIRDERAAQQQRQRDHDSYWSQIQRNQKAAEESRQSFEREQAHFADLARKQEADRQQIEENRRLQQASPGYYNPQTNTQTTKSPRNNASAALASFIIPGLGQLAQGRLFAAIFHFALCFWLWHFGLGWIVHLCSSWGAAHWKGR